MRKRKVIAAMLLSTVVYWCSPGAIVVLAQPAAPAAPSYPMQVSPQDQQTLRQVCALAQKETTLTLEQATGIGQYCLGLINRIGLALSAKQPAGAKLGETNKPSTPNTLAPKGK